MISCLEFLAQATTRPAQSSPGSSLLFNLMPFALIFLILYMIMLRPQKKERDKVQKMLDALKKSDRVMTIGGLIGTVVQVKNDEVVLKVDETTNTKLTFTRAAIKTVLSSAPGEEQSS